MVLTNGLCIRTKMNHAVGSLEWVYQKGARIT